MIVKEEDALYKAAQEHLNAYLRKHTLRKSSVRDIVLRQICALRQPFTEAQLEEACLDAKVAKATVYNTLGLLIKAEIITVYERGFGQQATRYELTNAYRSHMQIICKKCGRRASFYDKAVTLMLKEHKYANFEAQNYTLVVYGECRLCRTLSVKKKKI